MQNSQNIYASILETIYTKKQRVALLRAIDAFLPLLYNIKTDPQAKMNELFSYEASRALFSIIEKGQIDFKNPASLEGMFHGLQKEVESMPILSLTLAFHPNGEMLKKISDWLNSAFQKRFIIDFVVDSKIVAGVIISYAGAYRDYSFRAKFAEIIEKKNFLKEI